MINGIHAPAVGASVVVATTKSVSVPLQETGTPGVKTAPLESSKISTLSRQLSDSAERAEKRDNSLSRSELGDYARKLKVQLIGNVYQANKAKHNREIPDTKDPELLVRARQATDHLTSMFEGDNTVKNPFAGLSREQLNLIVYDEAGPYTVNERRAAWGASQKIEEAWRTKVVAAAWIESAHTDGKAPEFFTEVLAHYKSLPLIEQSLYPEDYEAGLQANIDKANGAPEQEEEHFLTLLQILARMRKPEKDTDSADPEIKTSSLSPGACPTPAAVPRS